jgi:hypothetical protein
MKKRIKKTLKPDMNADSEAREGAQSGSTGEPQADIQNEAEGKEENLKGAKSEQSSIEKEGVKIATQTISNCPKCLAPIEKDSDVCKQCGCNIELYYKEDFLCPSCGNPLRPGFYKCQHCNVKVQREDLIEGENALKTDIDREILLNLVIIKDGVTEFSRAVYVPYHVKGIIIQGDNCLILNPGLYPPHYFPKSIDLEDTIYLLIFNQSKARFHFLYDDLITREGKGLSCTVYLELEIGDFSKVLSFMMQRSNKELAFVDFKEILYSRIEGLIKPTLALRHRKEIINLESRLEDELRAQVLPRISKLLERTGLTLTESQIYLDIDITKEEERTYLAEGARKQDDVNKTQEIKVEEDTVQQTAARHEDLPPKQLPDSAVPPKPPQRKGYIKPAIEDEDGYIEEEYYQDESAEEIEETQKGREKPGKWISFDKEARPEEYAKKVKEYTKVEYRLGKGMWVFLISNAALAVILIVLITWSYYNINRKGKQELQSQIQWQEHAKTEFKDLQEKLDTQIKFLNDMAKNPGLYGLKIRLEKSFARLIQNNRVGDIAHNRAIQINAALVRLDVHLQNLRSDSVKATMDRVENEITAVDKVARNRLDLQTPQDMIGGVFVNNDIIYYQQSTFAFYRLPNGDTDKEFSVKTDGILSPIEYGGEMWFIGNSQGKSQIMAFNFARRELRNISLDSKDDEELPAMEMKRIAQAGDNLLVQVNNGFYVFEKPEKGGSIRIKEVWKRTDRPVSIIAGDSNNAAIVGLEGSLELFDPSNGKLINAFIGNEVVPATSIVLYKDNIYYFNKENGLVRRKLSAPWPIIGHIDTIKAKEGAGVYLCGNDIFAYDGSYLYYLRSDLKDFKWRYRLDAKSISLGNSPSTGRVCVGADERVLFFINIDDYEDKNPLPDQFKSPKYARARPVKKHK